MKDFINRFKIPTVLGLGIIVFGIVAGVFLVVRQQSYISKASPDLLAQNIAITNISDNSAVISWQTSAPAASFVTYGQSSPDEQTALDDRDTSPPSAGPKIHLFHYITIKNLLPKTTYQYKIISSKTVSAVNKFTTASPLPQTGFSPVIGTVLDDNKSLDEGIAFLSIANAALQSALIKTEGNFLIPISQLRKADLSDNYPSTEETIAKLTIVSASGEANALFKLIDSGNLPPLRLGENLDLTTAPAPTPPPQVNKFDLNNDGKINAADNAVILNNFGKNPKDKRADLNGDNVVDQKDLDLMAKQINQ